MISVSKFDYFTISNEKPVNCNYCKFRIKGYLELYRHLSL